MQAKASLKRSRLYKKVYLDHDKSKVERTMESYLRLLVNTVAKDSLVVCEFDGNNRGNNGDRR